MCCVLQLITGAMQKSVALLQLAVITICGSKLWATSTYFEGTSWTLKNHLMSFIHSTLFQGLEVFILLIAPHNLPTVGEFTDNDW